MAIQQISGLAGAAATQRGTDTLNGLNNAH